PVEHAAAAVAGGARTPYAAAVALDEWFRSGGGFRYTNHPAVFGAAPLVSFVTQTRAGYCQYFAGAMALMLRYLGIPARVAVGFAGGTYGAQRHAWLVSDLDSHAWVEVWFKAYGWIPFDPTPPVPGSTRVPTLPGSSIPVESSAPPTAPTFLGIADFSGTSAVAGKLSRQNGLVRSHAGVGTRVPVVGSRGR